MAILVQKITFELYTKLLWVKRMDTKYFGRFSPANQKVLIKLKYTFWGKMNIKITVFKSDLFKN